MARQVAVRLGTMALALAAGLTVLSSCSIDDVVAYGASGGAGAGGGGAGGAGGSAGTGGAGSCDPTCKCLDLSGHRYMVCRDPLNREQAEMRCAEHGMQLVRPDSQEENLLVRGAASNSEVMSFWLGCDDVTTEGMVVWNDGVPLDQTYSNFIDIDPGDNEGQDCCAEYASASWHDEPCDSAQSVVCELY